MRTGAGAAPLFAVAQAVPPGCAGTDHTAYRGSTAQRWQEGSAWRRNDALPPHSSNSR